MFFVSFECSLDYRAISLNNLADSVEGIFVKERGVFELVHKANFLFTVL